MQEGLQLAEASFRDKHTAQHSAQGTGSVRMIRMTNVNPLRKEHNEICNVLE